MSSTFVTIHGLKELQAAMRELPQKMERRILNSALMQGAREIEREAKIRVPIETGQVKRNIRARPVKPMDGHTASVIVGVRRLTKKQVAKLRAKGKDSSSPFYWRHVEFGTSKMGARPFMRPAYESRKVEAVFKIKDALKTRIEKEAAKLRKWVR